MSVTEDRMLGYVGAVGGAACQHFDFRAAIFPLAASEISQFFFPVLTANFAGKSY